MHAGRNHGDKDGNNRLLQIISLLCLVITGIYAGYFGAASGVLMLVILNAISDDDFLTVNAMKNIIGALSNLVALIIYMFTAKIYWNSAIPLAIGALIGSYFGPQIMRHIPVKVIRLGIAIPLSKQLEKAISHIEGSIDEVEFDELDDELAREAIPADPGVKNYSYTIVDERVYYRENSIMKPVDVSETMEQRMKGMVQIRDCTQELIDYQLNEYQEDDAWKQNGNSKQEVLSPCP